MKSKILLQEKQPHSVTFLTDASSQDWGAHLTKHQIDTLNWTEICAIQLALIHLGDRLPLTKLC